MVRKKVPTELDKAEIKLRTLMERRDHYNLEAQTHRQERDQLHERKRALTAEMRKLKDERSAVVAELRAHKTARNECQTQAKKLIDVRRKARGKVRGSVSGELAALRKDVEKLEMDQQTIPMKLSEENELLDDLKAKVRAMRELEKRKGEEDQVHIEVKELDANIDELFKKADDEHAQVVAFARKADEFHERITEIVKSMAVLIAEANKKHEEYLAAREKADEQHQLVLDMREKVVTIRGAARAELREARQLLKEQRQRVRQELFDEKKLDEFADKAVQSLLKKGKVEIRG